MEPTVTDWIGAISSVVVAGAAVAAFWTWRQQASAQKHYEIANQLRRSVLAVRNEGQHAAIFGRFMWIGAKNVLPKVDQVGRLDYVADKLRPFKNTIDQLEADYNDAEGILDEGRLHFVKHYHSQASQAFIQLEKYGKHHARDKDNQVWSDELRQVELDLQSDKGMFAEVIGTNVQKRVTKSLEPYFHFRSGRVHSRGHTLKQRITCWLLMIEQP